MKVSKFDVYELSLRTIEPFVTAFGAVVDRPLLILRAESVEGVVAWGEGSALADPVYMPDTSSSVLDLLARFFLPTAVGKSYFTIEDVFEECRQIRGNSAARAAFESVMLDLLAREKSISLTRLIGGQERDVECGISLGIYPSVEDLMTAAEASLHVGFRRLKLKVRPGWDLEPVKAVRAAFPKVPIMIDANASYDRDSAAALIALDGQDLLMIEQPFGVDDLVEHAWLAARCRTPICLDESAASLGQVRAAVALGAVGVVNMKLSRVGGFGQALTIAAFCSDHEIKLWCGGVFESAIGQADGLALASLASFSLPADIGPSERYFLRDVAQDLPCMVRGIMRTPIGVGRGITVDEEFVSKWGSYRFGVEA